MSINDVPDHKSIAGLTRNILMKLRISALLIILLLTSAFIAVRILRARRAEKIL